MPTIAVQMPLLFDNRAVWSSLVGYCDGCGQKLRASEMRGQIVRPTAHMASVEAVGICRHCTLLTRFVYRLHDDMTITGPSPHDGKWAKWKGRKTPFWHRLVDWLL